MAALRLRFRLNQQTGATSSGLGGTRGADNFSRVIVEEVALTYGTGLLEKLKRDITQRMRQDIDRELDHMAKMFMGSVIGIPGRNRGPNKQLTTVAPRAEAMRDVRQMNGVSVRALTGNWAPRSLDYLRRLPNNPPWFQRHDSSPLQSLRSAKTWTQAYGGVSISVQRHTSFNPSDAASQRFSNRLGGTRGGKGRVGVATIRVDAMRRITPQMLPALGGGGLGEFGSNPQGSGLLSLLGEKLAWRLGGNPRYVPFRPTIQPFLGYFLTRQLPNAVFKRIEQGLQGRLSDGTGSAGRTRR